ncbi:MAG TPA: ABC transporter ATP-binding protein [Opitutaceae bacterium]|jgi:subfamily B ATP-binding cassette protein MsbA
MRRLRPYFCYLRPVRAQIGAAIFFGIVMALTSGFSLPVLIKYVFPMIFDQHDVMPVRKVVLWAAAIPAAFLVRALGGYLNSYFAQHAGIRILEAVRGDYFAKLQVLPLSFVQGESTGDLISRGMADTAQLQSTLSILASDGFRQPVMLLSAMAALAWFAFTSRGVPLVLISFLILPLAIFPVRFVGKKVLKRAHELQGHLGSVTGHFAENLSAAREVRAYGLEKRESDRFSALTRDLVRSQTKIAKYSQAITPAIEFIAAAGIAVTLVYSRVAGIDESTFVAICTALYMSYDPVKRLGALNNEMKRGQAAIDRLEVILNAPVTIRDPEQPVDVGRLRGDIAFEGIEFEYKPGKPVLWDVSTRIPAGTACALVGPSGAGKTTFINLVPRFYEAASGRITIDGIDIRSMRLADLRRNIAVVSQEPILFNDTIYNNLLLGRPGATRGEVEEAARDANAHDFISGLPLGYETIVGERGALVSGGQRQRLAIARAFLRNAPILILDEATSSLDSESEAAIQAALEKLLVGKTALIISHRFSTIRNASMILLFDSGRIVATGAHQALHSENSLYRSLYDRQTAAR